MFILRLKASVIDANNKLTLAPWVGVPASSVRLLAGRVGGIELAITSTALSIPDVVALQIPVKVARSLAQWVDQGVAEVLNNGVVMAAADVLQLGYERTKATSI
jgi:hypothetical protein